MYEHPPVVLGCNAINLDRNPPKTPKETAMKPLPPFSIDATCPKCLSMDIRTTWKPEARCFGTHGELQPNCPEHITRTCRTCGFTWNEATADAKE